MSKFGGSTLNQETVIGHPVGLFLLFFTEMWERFSFYGMRILLVLFLTDPLATGGFGWGRASALQLLGWYMGLVYLTPIIGGWIADKKIGFRNAVVLGALLMTAGHGALAIESTTSFYVGLGLLIIGNGFFKPNISSIVGQLYPDGSPLKDSAYTIFYMGINSGAFLGILICGYLGEFVSWSHGFGCAGIFMFFGMLQFWFGQSILGDIGKRPSEQVEELVSAEDKRLTKVERDRLIVIGVLAFFTIFFWAAFEQASGTMNIFARDYTDRSLNSAMAVNSYRILSLCVTFIPMLLLTWVLVKMAAKIFHALPMTILFTALSFVLAWGAIGWMNYNNFMQASLEVPASWFGTLNSFFIISMAPLFSMLWVALGNKELNPSGPVKFAVGLILLGLGFAVMVVGSSSIPQGAQAAKVSMIWLVITYTLHTMGELCLSPVGLSFVSKLSPKRLLGLMFGIFFLANFFANLIAGQLGSYMDQISETSKLSSFFSIFVVSSFVAAAMLLLLNKRLKRMMHGVT